MSETTLRIQARSDGWHRLPDPDDAQRAVLERAEVESLVVRGAPGSGRTTCALQIVEVAAAKGQSALLLVPDRVRVDALAARVQALAPTAVRPVRTPASFAHHIVSTWRIQRADPLGPVELITGALQDRILADLIERVDAPWPQSIPQRMRAMPAFRAEARDLFARAGEAGIDGEGLIAAGDESGIAAWRAAGVLLAAYLEGEEFSVEHRDALRVDLSRIQSLAADLIDHWEERAPERAVAADAPAVDLIVVDDVQDCTPSTLALLGAFTRRGSRVVAFADSDVAIATYRGGEPHLDLRLASALGAPILDLGDVHATGPALRRCVVDVVSGITQSGPVGRRGVGVAPDATALPGDVTIHVGGSSAQLGAHISRAVRRHHLHDGIAWEDQAVIVRSSSMVEEVARHLRRGGVPVAGGSRAFDFVSQPSTRWLLALLAPDADVGQDEARELLASTLIGADGLELFDLLRALNAPVVDDDPEQAAPLDLVGPAHLLEDAELWTGRAPAALADCLQRAGALWAQRGAASQARPRQGLWQLWVAAAVADAWRDGALAEDEDSDWYDDQLDAVLALMRVADVWEQRNPVGSARDFAAELLAGSLPVDTIARVGVRPPGVAILTPAQAMGKHFAVVALVGLQDGSWPNTRLRTRVLRADLLADIGAGRTGWNHEGGRVFFSDVYSARRAVLDDERRLLAAAVSRCTRHLHIGAVSATEAVPSTFFDLFARHGDTSDLEDQEGIVQAQPAPAPLSLAGQVADLRRDAAVGGPDSETAVRLLALLAREGVASADPATWTGAGDLTSNEPIHTSKVFLSPSRFEKILECPLRWFCSDIGAGSPAGGAQQVGTLVHSIAEQHPHGTRAELINALEVKLDEAGLSNDTWEQIDFAQTARDRVEGLAAYVEGVTGDVEVEKRLQVEVGDAIISGRLDRIEHVDGGVRITDLKTGSAVPSKTETEENAQLALYQVALHEKPVEKNDRPVVGAQLVYLTGAKATLRTQAPLDEQGLARWRGRIDEAVAIGRSSRFEARPSVQSCRTCEFSRMCPAQDRGRKTVD